MDIHKAIGKLPRPSKGFVLPSHKYTGPYNPLHEQLDENDKPKPGHEPFNGVDEISMKHDICYRDNKEGKKKCDQKMLFELKYLEPKNIRERIDRSLVTKIMTAKHTLGLGVKWSDDLARELHKPRRVNYPRRRVFVKKANDIWAADLVDMVSLSRYNNGYKYILMVIDVFSKFGYAVPLKTKTAIATVEAFRTIFKKQKPHMLWVDNGTEFYNKTMAKLLEDKDIKIYSTQNEEKSCVVERWNRTIKSRLWKYFTANNTWKYIDILDSFIDKYNNTRHRSIKSTPAVAQQPSSHDRIFKNLYTKKVQEEEEEVEPKFAVGDKVRIFKKKKHFEKSYISNWTEEVFYISKVHNTHPITYSIKDDQGEAIKGSFYEPELQKTNQDVFRIEKVVKRRVRSGQKEVLVKWKGYDSKFNSWVLEKALEDLQ